MSDTPEHVCERDGAPLSTDWWSCVDGWLYGPCEDADCGGVCESAGDCPCPCHVAPPTLAAEVAESKPA